MTIHAQSEFALRKQTEAAKSLLADFRDEIGEDEAAKLDLVEGQTSLIEAISIVYDGQREELMLVEGIKAERERLKAREERLTKSAARKKALIERAMVEAEIKSLPLPAATLVIANRPAGLIVTEEADIPSTFYVTPPAPEPRLDRAALTKALRERRKAIGELDARVAELSPDEFLARLKAIDAELPAIPGADLDNGGVSLTVKVK